MLLVTLMETNILPTFLKIALHVALCCSVLTFLAGGFLYYRSIPYERTTVLTYLMKSLMILTGLTVIWHDLSNIILQYPVQVGIWFEASPQATCAMFPNEIIGMMIKCIILILSFRLYLTISPFCFHSLNHELIFEISLAMIVMVTFFESLLMYLAYGILCPNLRLLKLMAKIYGVTIPDEILEIGNQPPLLAIQAALVGVPEVMRKFLKYKSKDRSDMSQNSIRSSGLQVTPQEVIIAWIPMSERANNVDDNLDITDEANTETNAIDSNQVTSNVVIDSQGIIKTGYTVCFFVCMSISPILDYLSRDSWERGYLLLTIKIPVSLGLHLLPVVWVLNSDEILKYITRKSNNLFNNF